MVPCGVKDIDANLRIANCHYQREPAEARDFLQEGILLQSRSSAAFKGDAMMKESVMHVGYVQLEKKKQNWLHPPSAVQRKFALLNSASTDACDVISKHCTNLWRSRRFPLNWSPNMHARRQYALLISSRFYRITWKVTQVSKIQLDGTERDREHTLTKCPVTLELAMTSEVDESSCELALREFPLLIASYQVTQLIQQF